MSLAKNLINQITEGLLVIRKPRTATSSDQKLLEGFSRVFWVWDIWTNPSGGNLIVALGSVPRLGTSAIVFFMGGVNEIWGNRIFFPTVSTKDEGQELANLVATSTRRSVMNKAYARVIKFDGALPMPY